MATDNIVHRGTKLLIKVLSDSYSDIICATGRSINTINIMNEYSNDLYATINELMSIGVVIDEIVIQMKVDGIIDRYHSLGFDPFKLYNANCRQDDDIITYIRNTKLIRFIVDGYNAEACIPVSKIKDKKEYDCIFKIYELCKYDEDSINIVVVPSVRIYKDEKLRLIVVSNKDICEVTKKYVVSNHSVEQDKTQLLVYS